MRTYKQKRNLTLRQKIAGTLLLLLIYRLLSHVPLPFIDSTYMKALVSGNGSLGLLNMLTGGNLGNMSIMALGITPYITASIIVQLMGVLLPILSKMQKEGPDGQRRYKRVIMILAVILAFIESLGILIGYRRQGILTNTAWYAVLIPAIIMMAGAFLLAFMGQYMEKHFFGNGTSLILVTGILASYVGDALSLGTVLTAGKSLPIAIVSISAAIICVVLLFLFTTFISVSGKDISVTYSAKVSGQSAAQHSSIPLKLIGGGVVPIIFASTIITFPSLIQSFTGTDAKWLHLFNMNYWLNIDEPIASVGLILYLAMIIGFSYYYQALNLNEKELAEKLKKNGGVIPGIRPGIPTEQYLKRQMKWLIALGGICLCIVAIVPMLVSGTLGVANLSFLGTSIIITVTVLDETLRKYESEAMVHQYKKKISKGSHSIFSGKR